MVAPIKQSLRELANEMREAAKANIIINREGEFPVTPMECYRKYQYKGMILNLVFSLDKLERDALKFWHLSIGITGQVAPDDLVAEIKDVFFGLPDSKILELPKVKYHHHKGGGFAPNQLLTSE